MPGAKAEKTVALIGPKRWFRSFQIQLPTSEISEFFGLGEEGFAVAQLVFNALAFGNILRHAHDGDGITSVVVNGRGATVQDTGFAVGQNAAELAVEDFLPRDAFLHLPNEPITVIRMDHIQKHFACYRVLGINLKVTIKLPGPGSRTGAQVQFEAAHAGELFGLLQERFALQEPLGCLFAIGDISRQQSDSSEPLV